MNGDQGFRKECLSNGGDSQREGGLGPLPGEKKCAFLNFSA